MKLLVKGKNVDVSDSLQVYAEKRLGKLSKQLDDDLTRVELELAAERNPRRSSDCHIAEVTVWTKGPTLRAHEAAHDPFAAIDLVAEKLARQVQKYREKRVQYRHGGPHHNGHGRYRSALRASGADVSMINDSPEGQMAQQEAVRIVKTKQFRLGPMSPEQAAEQMELVGHDFFVFVDGETDQTCVLYRRSDGDYGLIEQTLAEAEAS